MSAILFGSISTIADTSELQRRAFNEAFTIHGLDWNWDQEEYRDLLQRGGGAQRIADHASSIGQRVDAAAVHATKSAQYQEALGRTSLQPRAGVVETIRGAKDAGQRLALVTTTSPENVAALLSALSPAVRASDFDLVVDSSTVDRPKPDAAAYSFALATLAERAADCVAIEDNLGGLEAAVAADVPCVAFPNTNTAAHGFDGAQVVVDRLELDQLVGLQRSA